jgi:hypothetical protein
LLLATKETLTAGEAAKLSRIQGHHWRVERIQNIKHYLHQQTLKFGKAEMDLDEALNGPIEHWNIPQTKLCKSMPPSWLAI